MSNLNLKSKIFFYFFFTSLTIFYAVSGVGIIFEVKDLKVEKSYSISYNSLKVKNLQKLEKYDPRKSISIRRT